MLRPQTKRIKAPRLEGGLAWLNVDRPLTMRELRGSVVLLDFWTYCCINCMHVLPTLREIEHRYRREPLVVIGVHSGKFAAERDPDRIREAIGRYGVEHPVIVDDDMAIWSAYAIRSWPTLVVVRPDGTIAAVAPGEPDLEILDTFIRGELDAAKQQGKLADKPPRIDVIRPASHSPLCYPGKVACLPDGRIAISDSGHHRVLLCEADGEVVETIGSGLRGYADGALQQAAFDDPQGCCWYRGALYVADARNHAIRRVDFFREEVTTVAGNGVLGLTPPEGRCPATDVALRSPWDLCLVDSAIYVAMAGSHQIWRFWPESSEIEVYAGTGVEALLDGGVAKSAWAQPSGMAERDGILYVADSETSAVRAINLADGMVDTLIGQGLFDFGDGEGIAKDAMLQHCLGVCVVDDGLLVADTYNGKLKLLRWESDSKGHTIQTELSDLNEPGAVATAHDGATLVADTNAHRVLRWRAGKLEELNVRGAPEPQRGALSRRANDSSAAPPSCDWFTALLQLPEGVGLKPGDGGISLLLSTPQGTELADEAPITVGLEVSRRSDLLELVRNEFTAESRQGNARLLGIEVRVNPLPEAIVEAELVATIDYVVCHEEDHAMCSPGRVFVRLPVRLLREGGSRQLEFGIALAPIQTS